MRKFSTVINSQANGYVAVLNCWEIDAEGNRVEVDAKSYTNLPDYPSAIAKAVEFYDKNKTED
jgi:hypothetical protein